MFTWVCPTCGRELDIATKDCPECAGGKPPAPTVSAAPADVPPPATVPVPSRLLLAGIGLLVVAVLVIGWAMLRGRGGSPAPERTNPAALESVSGPPVPDGLGDIEISGVRPFYDERNRAHVRVIVINHGEQDIPELALRISLRPRRAPPSAPPLARLVAKVSGLQAGASREVTAPLEAFGTLASLPGWRDLRADLE